MNQINVFLADHNPNLRRGLRSIIEQIDDMTVVGETADGQEALRQIQALRPEVVVLSTQLHAISGIEVTQTIQKQELGQRVLVLGATETREEVLPLLQAGALGYVLRYEASEVIAMAVPAVARGAGFFSPTVAAQMAYWMGGAKPKVAGLTHKELAVVQLLAQGKSNKEIASRLALKERTIEYHVSKILAKLKLDSRTKAAMWAKERRLDQE